jgi:hypothetical protein
LTDQVEVDIKTHAIRAHIIESGIHHAGGEGIDLHFTRPEVGASGAGQGHMERALPAEIVAQGRLIVVSNGHAPYPREDRPSMDFRYPLQINPSRSQLALIHHGK